MPYLRVLGTYEGELSHLRLVLFGTVIKKGTEMSQQACRALMHAVLFGPALIDVWALQV